MDRFDYPFDESLIASAPLKERDQSRLFVYHRKTDTISHQRFSSVLDILHPNDLLVINDTQVFPARLFAQRDTLIRAEENIELLLIRPDINNGTGCWEALVRGKVPVSSTLILPEGGRAFVVEESNAGRKKIVFDLPGQEDIYAYLDRWGKVPLPPYILRKREKESRMSVCEEDHETYQTVYANRRGSVAAPTAGLHFTPSLLAALKKKGVSVATVTLHIGTDTFRPIRTPTLDQHKMSGESFEILEETAYAFAKTKACGGTVYAVGTSVVRVLETAARTCGQVAPLRGETNLFITPGYRFRAVDALITNLHPPRSTGLVLVSAFAGCDTVLRLYQEAMKERYRFFSYGDAMLIL